MLVTPLTAFHGFESTYILLVSSKRVCTLMIEHRNRTRDLQKNFLQENEYSEV